MEASPLVEEEACREELPRAAEDWIIVAEAILVSVNQLCKWPTKLSSKTSTTEIMRKNLSVSATQTKT